jgi:hypothetical protein
MKCKNCEFSRCVGFDRRSEEKIFECHLVEGKPVYRNYGDGCCEFWKEKKNNIIWLVEKKE